LWGMGRASKSFHSRSFLIAFSVALLVLVLGNAGATISQLIPHRPLRYDEKESSIPFWRLKT